MNPNLLKRLFPNASPSTIKRNVDFEGELSRAVAQPIVRLEPEVPDAGEKENSGRCAVRIVSCRMRLLDPDNLCPKFFIDALRYERIIRDDSAKHIILTVEQRKVKSHCDECTIIEITRPCRT